MIKMIREQVDAIALKTSAVAAFMQESETDTLQMVSAALTAEKVCLAYQPVVHSTASKQVNFYEGLIRVLDPTGRPIPARSFMPVVEAHEIGREIDCAALSLGFKTLKENTGIRLSINMSARSIGYPKWASLLRSQLHASPHLANRLVLEISEKSAMQLPEIIPPFIEEWGRKGVSFAIDNFGAGEISIRRFHSFNVNIVKIDGSLTRKIHVTSRNQNIVAALLAVTKQFGRVCVAEAVESEQDAKWLASLGFDFLQGYAFGEPTVSPTWLKRKSV